MKNEVVKYSNNMNSVALRKFNATEMDIFYALCSKVKNKGTEDVILSFDQLKSLSDYKPTANSRFINDLRQTNKKLLSLQFTFEDENILEDFVLFTTFSINKTNETMTISVNKRFEFMFNAITGGFTLFELEKFTSLDSKYTKIMFRLLKQWRTQGKKEYEINEFRDLLSIPKSYKTGDIDRYVLNPIKKELTSLFIGLNVEKIKRGRGNKIVGLRFTFQKEQATIKDEIAFTTETGDHEYDLEKIEEKLRENAWK